MVSASTQSANEPAKDLILVHTDQLKLMIKAHFSGRMISSGINDVVFSSLHSEKSRLKKLIMIIIIKIIMMAFSGRHKLTSTMKLKPEK